MRQWEEGQPLLFDDSYEHEVWHGDPVSSAQQDESIDSDILQDRVVLLFDIWHPDLTTQERQAIVGMFASVGKTKE